MFAYFRLISSGNQPYMVHEVPSVVVAGRCRSGRLGRHHRRSGAIRAAHSCRHPRTAARCRGRSNSRSTFPIPPGLESASVGARSIEMILDRRDPDRARGRSSRRPAPGGDRQGQAQTQILSANKIHPHTRSNSFAKPSPAMPWRSIVEPADPADPQMAEVVQKARRDGIPVVLVNRPLASQDKRGGLEEHPAPRLAATNPAAKRRSGAATSAGAKPLVVVAPPPFTDSARQARRLGNPQRQERRVSIPREAP